MNQNLLKFKENRKKHNSEFILRILDNVLIEGQTYEEKELYVDENWKITSKDLQEQTFKKESNLQKILSELFPNNEISVTQNKDGSQTISIL